MRLLAKEKLEFSELNQDNISLSDEEIEIKYQKGDVRIVTEQARYPLNTIVTMISSGNYQLDPEFQRRHRWNNERKSRLIESFIINIPIPPIFLYEDKYSHYQVMDGLQRLTAINEFYKNQFPLTGLAEWPELTGKTYSQLPEKIRQGIDRRYLSSIILLEETAKSPSEAERLKQLVFERINSGGVKLSYQEARNAIYDGPLNRVCIKLARNENLCRTWNIPIPVFGPDKTEIITDDLVSNKHYEDMTDVELVLRFFAYRQKQFHNTNTLSLYFDRYLKYGNTYSQNTIEELVNIFENTIKLVYDVFGDSAFHLYRHRNGRWGWLERPTTAIYDPLMYVMSNFINRSEELLGKADLIKSNLEVFYKEHNSDFAGRNINPSILAQRDNLFLEFINNALNQQ